MLQKRLFIATPTNCRLGRTKLMRIVAARLLNALGLVFETTIGL
jgi:hypothetical protein